MFVSKLITDAIQARGEQIKNQIEYDIKVLTARFSKLVGKEYLPYVYGCNINNKACLKITDSDLYIILRKKTDKFLVLRKDKENYFREQEFNSLASLGEAINILS